MEADINTLAAVAAPILAAVGLWFSLQRGMRAEIKDLRDDLHAIYVRLVRIETRLEIGPPPPRNRPQTDHSGTPTPATGGKHATVA